MDPRTHLKRFDVLLERNLEQCVDIMIQFSTLNGEDLVPPIIYFDDVQQ